MKLIDTHAHLYLHHFKDDIENVIDRAKNNAVCKVVLPNIDSGSINPMLDLSAQFPGFFYPAMGVHPGSVKENYLDELEIVKTKLSEHSFVAVGEVGIDCYWDTTFLKEQIQAFEFQLELAHQHQLPVIIHCRDSFDLIIESLEKFRGKVSGVFHAFTGNLTQAEQIIDFGFNIGIGGVVTFKNSGLPDVVSKIPMEVIMLETDSPYLTPTPHRGKRNESAYILNIAERIAEIKNISLEEVSNITTGNAVTLFKLH
jgi:TatD DNase family protein